MNTPLFVALDTNTLEEAKKLIDRLQGHVEGLKIGPRLFALGGVPFLQELVAQDYKVFLDLKLHDIPNTVALALDVLSDLGLFCLTVHGGGGTEMLRRAVEARDKRGSVTKILGITVLTSFSEQAWQEINPGLTLQQALIARAQACVTAGIDGLVCSAQDLSLLKPHLPAGFLKVTPGVRFASLGDDQTRVMTPYQALKVGADYLVMGRPIYQSDDLEGTMREFKKQVEEARNS